MSSIRPPKWDWSSHLPKMVELYNTQMSIPDIYKAIQCDGFEPCQRSVYAKFKSMGYPTDPVGRSRLLEARLPQNPPSIPMPTTSNSTQSPAPSFYTNQLSEPSLCTLPEDSMLAKATELWGNSYDFGSPSLPQNLNYTDINGDSQSRVGHLRSESHGPTSNPSTDVQTFKSGPSSEVPSSVWSPCSDGASPQTFGATTNTLDEAYDFETSAMEINGAEYFGIDTGSYHHQVALPATIHEEHLLGTKSSGLGWEYGATAGSGFFSADFSNMELDNDSFSFQEDVAHPLPRRSGSIDLKTPFQNFINTSSTAGTRNKLRSLFRAKSGSSSRSAKKYATSQHTNNTQDSGYVSGFASCLTLEDIRQINSQSLREFNGLYRVACHNLHEPQGKSQCKDIVTCTYCKYSSIHNLGWSARYLKLEVFLSELKLDAVYNFQALDATGNTALHYAAAGGAGFLHLKALIDAGVDPYAANTSGELFIYCLRPIQPFTLEPNSDCLKSDDLISLLNLLKPERVFGWRDNDGQTILHALSSKITEPELRVKILQMFKDTGYPPTFLDRFGRTAEDVMPLTYDCHGQVIDAAPVNFLQKLIETTEATQDGMTCEDLITADWRQQQVKQIKAQNILLQARQQPTYKDPETDDNVLHALSRLRSSNDTLLNLEHFSSKETKFIHNREGNHILLNLEHFIPKGIDLNLLNHEGNYPLKSFICDRPLEDAETGATLSKYLDLILWKDPKARIPNAINVNMKDRAGATALHCAAIRGRPDSLRSLIEAGANVNSRSDDGISVLQAACNALDGAMKHNQGVLVHLLKEVISYLEHSGAVLDPKSIQERGIGAVRSHQHMIHTLYNGSSYSFAHFG